MIADSLENCEKYESLNPLYKQAFAFCRDFLTNPLPCGRYDLIKDDLYAMVSEYDSAEPNSLEWEGHREYVDIQFLAVGQECIGWLPIQKSVAKTEYNKEQDFLLFDDAEGTFIHMKKGDFSIFYPEDVHKPKCICGTSTHNVKIVIKVKL